MSCNKLIIEGRVIEGNKVGRRLGFPTANLDCLVPDHLADGVYAGRTVLDGREWKALVNVGYSPSIVANGSHRVEVHIVGYNGDLYGQRLKVEIVRFIRPECRFDSPKTLSEQITRDLEQLDEQSAE